MRCRLLWLGVAGCDPWTIENQFGGELEPPPEPVESGTVTETLELPEQHDVPVDEECRNACPSDRPAWDVVVEGSVTNDAAESGMPLVAHLDDDDGDGVIGSAQDRPEIALVTSASLAGGGALWAWSGDGTDPVVPMLSGLYGYSQAAAADDLDGDGNPELVVDTGVGREHVLTAFALDGTVLWTSEVFGSETGFTSNMGCHPVVTDLEADGSKEVFCGGILVDGATGATRAWFDAAAHLNFFTSTIADLDLDGVAEIVGGNAVWRRDGSLWWQAPLTEEASGGTYPAVVQLDSDPEGEVVFASAGSLWASDTDGTVLWQSEVNYYGASSPCVADFDGDGQMEIAAAFGTVLAMFETDGTRIWTVPVDDGSTAAGCSAFDADLDGRAELVYADQTEFSLFCGTDGQRLYTDPGHVSGTSTEYPVVADVDADGAAEVLVVGDGTAVIYGQRDGRWPGTGQVWPQYDHQPLHRTGTGTLDGTQPSWLSAVGFHAALVEGTVVPFETEQLVKPILELHDRIGGCEGTSLSVGVSNGGTFDAPEGLSLEVWSVDAAVLGDLTERLVRTVLLPAVPSGVALSAVQIDLGPEDMGAWGFHLRLPPDPVAPSCDSIERDLMIPLPCDR